MGAGVVGPGVGAAVGAATHNPSVLLSIFSQFQAAVPEVGSGVGVSVGAAVGAGVGTAVGEEVGAAQQQCSVHTLFIIKVMIKSYRLWGSAWVQA